VVGVATVGVAKVSHLGLEDKRGKLFRQGVEWVRRRPLPHQAICVVGKNRSPLYAQAIIGVDKSPEPASALGYNWRC
jgi:hypothetical protein